MWRWLRTGHDTCPVCKAHVEEASLVPLYGRGRPRPPGDDVPRRPAPARREAPAPGADAWGVHVQLAAGFSFFPALVTLLWTTQRTGRPPGAPRRPGEARADAIAWLLVSLCATFALLVLLV